MRSAVSEITMKPTTLLLCCALGLLLGCSPEDEQDSALENVEENAQEYHNTATDPAGPGEVSPPSTPPAE
ncbi:hypothetical protein YO5_18862 [Stutzerimonas stutzeri TS44]|nr:hypothetical protein YO5_18862 [Stutzerimonas stutzeri TS44]